MEDQVTGMPDHLIIVRHGQSAGNAKKREFEKTGDEAVYTREFMDIHDSQYLLTEKGFEQARLAGEFLKEMELEFDRCYVSNIVRAQLTAGTLGLGLTWFEHPDLREHEGGLEHRLLPSEKEKSFLFQESSRFQNEHPYLSRPLGGESLADTEQRVKGVLDTIGRECSGKNVIIVCHGNVIRVIRMILERMPIERKNEYLKSEDEWARVPNCSIFHYSRINPKTMEREKYLNWLAFASPSEHKYRNWEEIKRPRYSDQELITRAYANAKVKTDQV